MSPREQHAQRLAALDVANERRSYRANVKAKMVSGERLPDEVLACGDPMLVGMTIEQLLIAIPGIRKARARALLSRGHISASMTLGELTARQQGFLLNELRQFRESSPNYQRFTQAVRA